MYQHHCSEVNFEIRSLTGSGTTAPASMKTVITSDS